MKQRYGYTREEALFLHREAEKRISRQLTPQYMLCRDAVLRLCEYVRKPTRSQLLTVVRQHYRRNSPDVDGLMQRIEDEELIHVQWTDSGKVLSITKR